MIEYPHIDNIPTSLKKAKIFFNVPLIWTYKEDGSNIGIGYQGKDVMIRTRNCEPAHEDIIEFVKRTKEWEIIEPFCFLEQRYQFFVEGCRKGRSITGAKEYENDILICFDIYDKIWNTFLPYRRVLEICGYLGLPIVTQHSMTKHINYSSLKRYSNYILDCCRTLGIEGMVAKTNPFLVKHPEPPYEMNYCQFKVKLDIPEATVKKIAKGETIYPDMPENEIWGAIDKAWQELGTEDFKDKAKAMPLIAKYVSEEAKKHCYKVSVKLFYYYNAYIERHLIKENEK